MNDRELSGEDLDHILTRASEVWTALRGRRILITGGTGFVGSWLVEALARANRQLALGSRAVVLTRRPAAFLVRAPHLARDPAVSLHQGDLLSCTFPDGELDGIIHAASSGYAVTPGEDLPARIEGDIQGTRRVLELARERGARLLFTSSGAIYGPQPPGLTHLAEEHADGPDPTDPEPGYARGKRVSEDLCVRYWQEHAVPATIARCFAFVGPRLPLDAGFAVGNFIRDALAGGPIRVQGDGTARRSYLYAADLAIWLWTIWSRGAPGRAYNVGSEADLSIAEIARAVARIVAPSAEISIARPATPGQLAGRYVPSTRRAREELGLRQHIALGDAIQRTAAWHRPVPS